MMSDVDRRDVWMPAVEGIDALFDDDPDRAERAFRQALGQARKLKAMEATE